MSEIVFLVEDDPDGGYTARALGESIFTQADDLDALRENIRDAVRCHFGVCTFQPASSTILLVRGVPLEG